MRHAINYREQGPLCRQRLGYKSEMAWSERDTSKVTCKKCQQLLTANGHHFFYWKDDKYLCCKLCGNIRRADGRTNRCRGKARITLRAAQP